MSTAKMKFHRVVLKLKNERPVVMDFGWFYKDQINESIHKIRGAYPGYKLIRHFAISESEMYNGLDHKLKEN